MTYWGDELVDAKDKRRGVRDQKRVGNKKRVIKPFKVVHNVMYCGRDASYTKGRYETLEIAQKAISIFMRAKRTPRGEFVIKIDP